MMARTDELSRIEALEKDMLAPADVCKVLQCAAYTINVATREGKNPFPFPVIRIGNRVRIPKLPFLKAMRGELPYYQENQERMKTNEKERQEGYAGAYDGDRESCPF